MVYPNAATKNNPVSENGKLLLKRRIENVANPLENIDNIQKIYAVIANGRVFLHSDLEKLPGDVGDLVKK